MTNRPPPSDGQDEHGEDWLQVRADLLQIRQNVADILTLRAIQLLEIVGRDDYIAILRTSVLNVMRRGDYSRALENLRDFVLEDPVLDKILPELMDNAEPGLAALDRWADEYELDG